MIRGIFTVIVLLSLAIPAAARDVLVVQGVRSKIFDDALKGFRCTCSADSRTLVLSDYSDPELARVIQEERPRVVVAVGDSALASVRKIRKTPVVGLMALSLSAHNEDRPNLTGVSLFVKPEQYLSLFKRIKVNRIGVVYDPSRAGSYVALARAAARQHGLELVLREVSAPRQVMGQLASLRGSVDALWLLPDATAVSGETLEAYFLFAQGQSIPVVSFSASHLRLGALFSVEADRVELGKQGGDLAQQLLRGAQPDDLPVSSPRKVSIKVNDAVAKWLKYPAELMAPFCRK